MTEFSDEIDKLKHDLKKAEKYEGKESKEFQDFREVATKLQKDQKEGKTEHVERLREFLIKEEGQMSKFERKLEKFAKKIIEEIPYLEKAVDNKKEVEDNKKKLINSISRLREILQKDSELFKLLNENNWEGPKYRDLKEIIDKIKYTINHIETAMHSISLELDTKKQALQNYKDSDESVAADLKIAGMVSNFWNDLFYDGENYVDKHMLYTEIRGGPPFGGLYIFHRISQADKARIKLKEKYVQHIKKAVLRRINDEEILDELSKSDLLKPKKEWKLPDKVVADYLEYLLSVLYEENDERRILDLGIENDINTPEKRVEILKNLIKKTKYMNSSIISNLNRFLSFMDMTDLRKHKEYYILSHDVYYKITERLLSLRVSDII